ncbi:MAG: ATP-binding protein [Saprospiraceae bacterium]
MKNEELLGYFLEMDLFRAVPHPVLVHLAERSETVQYAAGTPVFAKGEPGEALFLILSGSVKVHDGDYTVTHLHRGSCIGEIALIDEGPRSMSVTVTEAGALARIERETFFDVFHQHPEIMQRMVALLTRRLRQQTDQLVEQLRRREDELNDLVHVRTAELLQRTEEANSLRVQAEAQMLEAERQRQRAEQSERAEQQFLANMSHEIRTPMNAVIGMTRLLIQKSPKPDQMTYLDSIRQASESLLVILNDILDISKIQAGKLELEQADLQVGAVMDRVRSTLKFRAEEKGLVFRFDVDPQLPEHLVGDPVRLQQVLMNLAGNAIKFTEKGHVLVQASLMESADDRRRVRFSVSDTGIGMSEAQLQVVFDSFRQASGDTTRKYGGTGLGLSIAKQLVELFGGTLEVRSTPGAGSEFWFIVDLPVGAAAAESEELPADVVRHLRGLRILVAEDNSMNRVVAVETLQLLIPDVHVETAENGREAFEKVQSGHFDVVLMDVHMPELDGMEATRSVRALSGPVSKIPIIAFTASVTRKDVQLCFDAGMNACVPKPFQDAELLRALLEVTSTDARGKDGSGPDDLFAFFKKQAGDKPERIQKYIDLYLASAVATLETIRSAQVNGDATALHRAVHTVKPQLKMIGMDALAEEAFNIEEYLKAGQSPESIRLALDTLVRGLEDTTKQLQAHRKVG